MHGNIYNFGRNQENTFNRGVPKSLVFVSCPAQQSIQFCDQLTHQTKVPRLPGL